MIPAADFLRKPDTSRLLLITCCSVLLSFPQPRITVGTIIIYRAAYNCRYINHNFSICNIFSENKNRENITAF